MEANVLPLRTVIYDLAIFLQLTLIIEYFPADAKKMENETMCYNENNCKCHQHAYPELYTIVNVTTEKELSIVMRKFID
jgi:hypothetical protein